jgi:hypothetical protein
MKGVFMSGKISADQRISQPSDRVAVYSSKGIIRMALGAIGMIAILAIFQAILAG